MNFLSENEKKRFTRHLILDEIGEQGQLKLKAGKVLVVGTGGLGSPVLYYLTAAGVGTIGIADNDTVDLSNLQRQILHSTPDLNLPKTDSASEKLRKLSPETSIVSIQERVTNDNVSRIISGYDVVVDATDNFSTRFILNEACLNARVPFVHGGVREFGGQAMTILPGEGPCLKCIFRTPPEESLTPLGVVGAVAGTIGTIQAAEVFKILLGIGRLLVGRLVVYDALEVSLREITVNPNPNCDLCFGIK